MTFAAFMIAPARTKNGTARRMKESTPPYMRWTSNSLLSRSLVRKNGRHARISA